MFSSVNSSATTSSFKQWTWQYVWRSALQWSVVSLTCICCHKSVMYWRVVLTNEDASKVLQRLLRSDVNHITWQSWRAGLDYTGRSCAPWSVSPVSTHHQRRRGEMSALDKSEWTAASGGVDGGRRRQRRWLDVYWRRTSMHFTRSTASPAPCSLGSTSAFSFSLYTRSVLDPRHHIVADMSTAAV